jgi:hypothetical protein
MRESNGRNRFCMTVFACVLAMMGELWLTPV